MFFYEVKTSFDIFYVQPLFAFIRRFGRLNWFAKTFYKERTDGVQYDTVLENVKLKIATPSDRK
jgi:hypothetical protein